MMFNSILLIPFQLFLGLSFLHLIPDTLHGIHDNESLMKIQKKYPFGELVIILGMILVLATEKFAGIIQINRKTTKVKCDGSENCCQEECAVQGLGMNEFFVSHYYLHH